MGKINLVILRCIFASIFLCFTASIGFAQENDEKTDDLLARLLALASSKFSHITQNASKYNLQIIYTQVIRDKDNHPTLKEFTYRLDPKAYFYPASLVKLPLVALSLEKLNEMHVEGVNKYTRMGTGKATACQTPIVGNNPYDKNPPSIARYIEQILLVSDNNAYTRLYEFLGQGYIHKKLREKEFNDIRIVRRFASACDSFQNRYTNPINFYDPTCKLIYTQPPQFNPEPYIPPYGPVKIGKGYYSYGKFIAAPYDFTKENHLSLRDVNDILIALILPEAVPPQKRFNLTNEDYNFLRQAMSAYPREGSINPYNPKSGYFDAYKKYLYYGRDSKTSIEPNIRIYNIVGWAYGYLTDCAYIVDHENNIEFFLSATIWANKNSVFNNEANYEYYQKGFPFLRDLGKLIHNYELTLDKKILPNFDWLKKR